MSELNEEPANATQHIIRTIRSDGSMKERIVWEPDPDMRARHDEALRLFHALHIPMAHAFGGVKGRGIFDNIAQHRSSEYFYQTDIKDAYPSVNQDRLRSIAERAIKKYAFLDKTRGNLMHFMENDAFLKGVPGLPLGLPASPYLCNLYFSPMDQSIHTRLNRNGDAPPVKYTRWIDDLTISAVKKYQLSKNERRRVREIVQGFGVRINHAKSKFHSLAEGPVTVTGMSLYPDGRIAPSPSLMDKVVKKLETAQTKLASGELDHGDLDELNGYKSILFATKTGRPKNSGQKSVRDLAERYDEFIALAKQEIK